jgi:TP901 family phage tail tape measure protein
MATERLDIIVRLRNATGAGLTQVRKGVSGIGTAATKSSGALRGFATQLGGIVALVGGGAFLGGAIKTFAAFDDNMRAAGAVTSATAEEMKAMTDIAKELGKTTRFTASDAAGGLRLLGMAGFEAGEAIKALPGVLNLAAAGNVELSQAADITTNVLSAFGIETEKLGRVNDVLVKTFTSSNTTIVELGEAFKFVGPIAKGVGADFEDLFAAMGKLGDAGLKGTLAGTALRGAINALMNPTAQETKLLGELEQRMGDVNLEITDGEGNFVGFVKIIEQLEKAGLRGEEALKLFGLRAGPGMAALLNIGSEKLKTLKDDIDAAGGISEDVAKQMESGIGGAMREAAAAFEAVKIAIGEAFAEDLIAGIRRTRDILVGWVNAIKQIKEEGTLGAYARAFETAWNAITSAIEASKAVLSEFTKVLIASYFAITGEFGAAKEAVKDFGSSIDALLEKKGLLENANIRESKAIQDNIDKVKRQIAQAKEKIAQSKADAASWRGRLVGAEKYDAQIEKYTNKVEILQDKLVGLERQKFAVDLEIKVEEIQADEYIDLWRVKLENAAQDQGPIGRGTQKIREALGKVTDVLSDDAKLKADLQKLRAALETEGQRIENDYAQGLLSLDQYFEERAKIVRERIGKELELLSLQRDDAKTLDKKEQINAQIYAKEQELQRALLQLDGERYDNQKSMEEEMTRERTRVNGLRLAAEQAFQDQKERLKMDSPGLEGEFAQEQAAIQERQAAELKAVTDFQAAEMELLRQQTDEKAILREKENEQRLALNQMLIDQEAEQERLAADQQQRLYEYRLENMANLAGSTADLFQGLYEITGKKNKEFFVAAKAAAIAEATINIAQAVTKALAQGGIFGVASAAMIGALGAVQIAKIASQGLAEGGVVEGQSPHSKADNIPIRATAGEFMQPVPSVKEYGTDAMEIIRRRAVPRTVLRSALGLDRFSAPPVRYGHRNFAEGGMVKKTSDEMAPAGGKSGEETQIVNVLDPQVFDQWAAGNSGKKSVMNIISDNIFQVRKMVFDNTN